MTAATASRLIARAARFLGQDNATNLLATLIADNTKGTDFHADQFARDLAYYGFATDLAAERVAAKMVAA